MYVDAKSHVVSLTREKIIDGKLIDNGYLIFDLSLLPNDLKDISALEHEHITYVVRRGVDEIDDGLWLIAIDGIYSVRELMRLPNNRIMLESKSKK
ncbi:putative bacteriophage CI repressor protein [Escherichia coli 2-210-07_S3_C2]|nr:putative bacteriophage CI repressor protein [Escherichia coli 2-210-07_S3_C2]